MCERYIERLPLTRPQLGIWPTTQARALPGNQTSDLSVCRPALSSLSHTSQGCNAFLKVECVYKAIEIVVFGGI